MNGMTMKFELTENDIKEAIKQYVEGISSATIKTVRLTVREKRDATDMHSMGYTVTAEAS